MTDGSITYTSSGEEIKSFHVRDGHAIKLAKRAGLMIAFITGRTSDAVQRRSDELGVDYLYQGAVDKGEALDSLLSETGLTAQEIAYIGDDLIDIPIVQRVGLGCAVSDGVEEVRTRADLVTSAPGGGGAVRELIEFILKAQGLWDDVISKYVSDCDA
jgi:YrbI family 3-deoxy-D-manno-octulosonate 8-phosphate phosphatase